MNDLDKFERELLKMAQEFKNGKYVKSHLKKEAKKLIVVQKDVAKGLIKKEKTGNFMKGFKVGKPYQYGGDFSIREYNNSPHAHLINNGHRIIRGGIHKVIKGQSVNVGGEEKGFVKGIHYVEKANEQFVEQYYDDTQKFIDDVLDKGLS